MKKNKSNFVSQGGTVCMDNMKNEGEEGERVSAGIYLCACFLVLFSFVLLYPYMLTASRIQDGYDVYGLNKNEEEYLYSCNHIICSVWMIEQSTGKLLHQPRWTNITPNKAPTCPKRNDLTRKTEQESKKQRCCC